MSHDRDKTPALSPTPPDAERAAVLTSSEQLGEADTHDATRDRASLTVLTGELAGALIRLGASDVVVGRSQDAGVRIADASLSRRHARFFRIDHQNYVQDLDSTNGTWVRGLRIDAPMPLHDGDHVQLGPNRTLRFNLSNEAEEDAAVEMYEATVRDPTSGAFNRRFFEGRLKTERALAEHLDAPLTLLLIDIDQFKRINDIHGHVLGDAVLRVLAASVQRLLRPEDTLIRYGGDEFVVLCRDTSLRNGLILAERIRAHVELLPLTASGNEFHITVSVGVSGGQGDEADWSRLVEAADRAMYRAKGDGRNTVVGG